MARSNGITRVKGGTPRPKALTKRNVEAYARKSERIFRNGGRAARVGTAAPYPPLRQT